jgi:hypothetical protein
VHRRGKEIDVRLTPSHAGIRIECSVVNRENAVSATYSFEVDCGIANLVRELNVKNYFTSESCEGDSSTAAFATFLSIRCMPEAFRTPDMLDRFEWFERDDGFESVGLFALPDENGNFAAGNADLIETLDVVLSRLSKNPELAGCETIALFSEDCPPMKT